MKQNVLLALGLLITLTFSGCSRKSELIECKPIVQYVKPNKPLVDKASVVQCEQSSLLEATKCTITNYYLIKQERDQLRMAIDEITE